jgi:hypothetical protein
MSKLALMFRLLYYHDLKRVKNVELCIEILANFKSYMFQQGHPKRKTSVQSPGASCMRIRQYKTCLLPSLLPREAKLFSDII